MAGVIPEQHGLILAEVHRRGGARNAGRCSALSPAGVWGCVGRLASWALRELRFRGVGARNSEGRSAGRMAVLAVLRVLRLLLCIGACGWRLRGRRIFRRPRTAICPRGSSPPGARPCIGRIGACAPGGRRSSCQRAGRSRGRGLSHQAAALCRMAALLCGVLYPGVSSENLKAILI